MKLHHSDVAWAGMWPRLAGIWPGSYYVGQNEEENLFPILSKCLCLLDVANARIALADFFGWLVV